MVTMALALLTSGAAWLFGPFGLLGAGLLLLVVALFVVDVREG